MGQVLPRLRMRQPGLRPRGSAGPMDSRRPHGLWEYDLRRREQQPMKTWYAVELLVQQTKGLPSWEVCRDGYTVGTFEALISDDALRQALDQSGDCTCTVCTKRLVPELR